MVETYSFERRTSRIDKFVVVKYDGKRRRYVVGILVFGVICYGLLVVVFREVVIDVVLADAGVGVRELYLIFDFNKFI